MEEERLYHLLIDTLPVGFLRVDMDGVIIDFNRTAEMITGYTREEVVGRSRFEVLNCPSTCVDDTLVMQVVGRSRFEALHCHAERNKCPLSEYALHRRENVVARENLVRRKSGDCILLSISAAPFFDHAGNFLGAIELFKDITESAKWARERKNFLSMFAHDMKNPLITVSGIIRRLIAGKSGPLTGHQQEYIHLVLKELDRVEELVADFLEFSRIEAAEYRPVREVLDINSLLHSQVERARMNAEEKGITLTLEPSASDMLVAADTRLISRAIDNLLDNAIRYTRPGGTVNVSVFKGEEAFLVRVSDTGVGIAEENIPQLFDAFYRVSREITGTGLGLTIAKAIVQAHGGKIWVESIPGQGSVFSFTLPVTGVQPSNSGQEVHQK